MPNRGVEKEFSVTSCPDKAVLHEPLCSVAERPLILTQPAAEALLAGQGPGFLNDFPNLSLEEVHIPEQGIGIPKTAEFHPGPFHTVCADEAPRAELHKVSGLKAF